MIAWVCAALAAPGVVNPRPANAWVSDGADVIDVGDEKALNARLEALHRDTDAELVVVTLASVSPSTPREFATDLFEEWGIGDREANNGLLVLLVMDERRIEMEVGYGLEPVLPDGWLGSVREQHMVPRFKKGDFGGGMVAGVERLDARLRENADEVRRGTGGAVGGVPPRASDRGVTVGATIFSVSALCFGVALLLFLVVGGVWVVRRWRTKQRTCTACDVYMPLLDEAADDAHLSPGQVREEELGSVDYDVHQCPSCQNTRTFRKGRWFTGYSKCPSCGHQTRTSASTTIRHATQYSGGLVEISESCGFCSHRRRYQRRTAPLPRVVVSSGGRGGGGFSGGGGFGGGGGGSFGGGRSGGGGGGSSW